MPSWYELGEKGKLSQRRERTKAKKKEMQIVFLEMTWSVVELETR